MEEHGDVKFNRPDRALRCPLYARFKRKDNGREFQFITNHLARGNARFRTQQEEEEREGPEEHACCGHRTLPSMRNWCGNNPEDPSTVVGVWDLTRAFSEFRLLQMMRRLKLTGIRSPEPEEWTWLRWSEAPLCWMTVKIKFIFTFPFKLSELNVSAYLKEGKERRKRNSHKLNQLRFLGRRSEAPKFNNIPFS